MWSDQSISPGVTTYTFDVTTNFNVGEQTVVAVGEVCWATELDTITSDIGLAFLEIDPSALRLIEDQTESFPSI